MGPLRKDCSAKQGHCRTRATTRPTAHVCNASFLPDRDDSLHPHSQDNVAFRTAHGSLSPCAASCAQERISLESKARGTTRASSSFFGMLPSGNSRRSTWPGFSQRQAAHAAPPWIPRRPSIHGGSTWCHRADGSSGRPPDTNVAKHNGRRQIVDWSNYSHSATWSSRTCRDALELRPTSWSIGGRKPKRRQPWLPWDCVVVRCGLDSCG